MFENYKNFGLMAKEESNALYSNNNFTRPNSKEYYLKLGQRTQVNALAFKLPVIKFKNEALRKKWEEILSYNNFLELLQKLEAFTYRNGIYALGFYKKNDITYFRIGEILDYKETENNLNYLKIKELDFNYKNRSLSVIKEYQDSFNSTWIDTFYIDRITNKKITDNLAELMHASGRNLELNNIAFIPWIIFKNNYEENSDIKNVDPSLFETLNNCYEMLLRDNYHSSPFIFTETATKSSTTVENTKQAVYNFDKRIISASVQDSLYSSDGVPLTFYQGNSISQSILQKIDKINFLIKTQLFLKMDSADYGTKNMHTAEAENLNSSYADMLETKANLREYYYQKFIFLVLKANGQILEINDIDVTVPGSTKYLKSTDAFYLYNQDGVNLNPNLTASNNHEENKENNEVNKIHPE